VFLTPFQCYGPILVKAQSFLPPSYRINSICSARNPLPSKSNATSTVLSLHNTGSSIACMSRLRASVALDGHIVNELTDRSRSTNGLPHNYYPPQSKSSIPGLGSPSSFTTYRRAPLHRIGAAATRPHHLRQRLLHFLQTTPEPPWGALPTHPHQEERSCLDGSRNEDVNYLR
jgi:hypothetical protein